MPRGIKMRRNVVLSLTIVVMMALAVPAGASPPTGFILQDTDAAYADFVQGDCEVFVGYVSTDRLMNFGEPGGFHPHSDLQVRLTGTCPGGTTTGTLGTLGNGLAEIVELDSADVNGIDVRLDDGRVATVDLHWFDPGDVIRWNVTDTGMHANHQTKLATLIGTVVVKDGETTVMTLDQTNATSGVDLNDNPRITHYTEINRGES